MKIISGPSNPIFDHDVGRQVSQQTDVFHPLRGMCQYFLALYLSPESHISIRQKMHSTLCSGWLGFPDVVSEQPFEEKSAQAQSSVSSTSGVVTLTGIDSIEAAPRL